MAKHRTTLRPKATTAGLALVVGFFLANASVSEYNRQRLAGNDAQVVRAQTVLTALEELLTTVTEAEAAERGFLITGDDAYLHRYHAAIDRVAGIFDRLAELLGGQANWQVALNSLRLDVDERVEELSVAIALRQSAGLEAARDAILNHNGRQLMREMRRLVDKMQGHQRASLVKWTAESQRTVRVATLTDVVDMLLGIATVALAYFLFRREWRQRERADDAWRRLAAIVESSDDAIVGETLDGTIATWNAGAERIYGYHAAEAIGQRIFLICPPEVIDDVKRNLLKVANGERIEPFESQRMRKDGEKITVSISVSPIRDANGVVIGASRISRDITQQKLLQREVLEIASREQQRLGQDLHDGTGQELTGLAMLASDLCEDLRALALPQATVAAKVVKGLEQALDHVRLLSKGLVPVVVDADGLMVALSELAARTDELSGVVCEFHCEEPVCIADNQVATQLFRLSQEAMSNALRHASADRIVIALRSVGDFVMLSIADDGRGLADPPDELSGSGLRIMRYRADLIGAKFEIAPNQPRGTVVSCLLAQTLAAQPLATAIDYLAGASR